jgi:hypothetical protein
MNKYLLAQVDPTSLPLPSSAAGIKSWLLAIGGILAMLIIGRFIQAFKNGAGVIGAVKAVLFGTNTPSGPLKVLLMFVGLAFALTGCTTQSKTTKQYSTAGAAIVQTSTGVVLYPSSYVSVTNTAGQVLTYAVYSAIASTNKQPFSFSGLFLGYDDSLTAFRVTDKESHSGSGKGLLADSKYTQLTSDFSSGARFGGTSALSVGLIDLEINTNAITASGNAGNQILQGIGSAAGQLLNKGVTGKP